MSSLELLKSNMTVNNEKIYRIKAKEDMEFVITTPKFVHHELSSYGDEYHNFDISVKNKVVDTIKSVYHVKKGTLGGYVSKHIFEQNSDKNFWIDASSYIYADKNIDISISGSLFETTFLKFFKQVNKINIKIENSRLFCNKFDFYKSGVIIIENSEITNYLKGAKRWEFSNWKTENRISFLNNNVTHNIDFDEYGFISIKNSRIISTKIPENPELFKIENSVLFESEIDGIIDSKGTVINNCKMSGTIDTVDSYMADSTIMKGCTLRDSQVRLSKILYYFNAINSYITDSRFSRMTDLKNVRTIHVVFNIVTRVEDKVIDNKDIKNALYYRGFIDDKNDNYFIHGKLSCADGIFRLFINENEKNEESFRHLNDEMYLIPLDQIEEISFKYKCAYLKLRNSDINCISKNLKEEIL